MSDAEWSWQVVCRRYRKLGDYVCSAKITGGICERSKVHTMDLESNKQSYKVPGERRLSFVVFNLKLTKRFRNQRSDLSLQCEYVSEQHMSERKTSDKVMIFFHFFFLLFCITYANSLSMRHHLFYYSNTYAALEIICYFISSLFLFSSDIIICVCVFLDDTRAFRLASETFDE